MRNILLIIGLLACLITLSACEITSSTVDGGVGDASLGHVETPSFSPSPGTFLTPQDVVISCSTTDVKIYFTTDGTRPNHSSPVYSAPVHMTVTTLLKAYAVKERWDDSEIQEGIYTIQGGGSDAGTDAGGTDAGSDAGSDAGADAGTDAGTCLPDGGSYSIGGELSGLGASKSITIKNNTSDYLTPNTNGNFTFNEKLQCGAAYAVKIVIQPNGQTCVLANESGTVTGDVTNVSITCN